MIDLLLTNAVVATMDGPVDVIVDGAVAIEGGAISWVGRASDAPSEAVEVVDLGGRLLTPGLVDCHTHLVFGGHRAREFVARLGGATYEELNKGGGGIVSTVGATRQASTEDLVASTGRRLGWLAAGGVTTVEVKTGYGLDLETELRMLDVIGALAADGGPDVVSTLLAHTVPPEYRDRRGEFVDLVLEALIPAAVGKADAVDVFCETIGFTGPETRAILETAQAHGFNLKVHADQITAGEGSSLAGEFGALSADHLEHADEDAVVALAGGGVTAVLIPGASSFLDESARPPIALLRKHGVPIAVATDLNPGTSPLGSATLAMNLACTRFGLTPAEALAGMTVHGARALGLDDRGRIAPGLRADLALWEVDEPAELSYWMAAPLCTQTWVKGAAQFSVLGSHTRDIRESVTPKRADV